MVVANVNHGRRNDKRGITRNSKGDPRADGCRTNDDDDEEDGRRYRIIVLIFRRGKQLARADGERE